MFVLVKHVWLVSRDHIWSPSFFRPVPPSRSQFSRLIRSTCASLLVERLFSAHRFDELLSAARTKFVLPVLRMLKRAAAVRATDDARDQEPFSE